MCECDTTAMYPPLICGQVKSVAILTPTEERQQHREESLPTPTLPQRERPSVRSSSPQLPARPSSPQPPVSILSGGGGDRTTFRPISAGSSFGCSSQSRKSPLKPSRVAALKPAHPLAPDKLHTPSIIVREPSPRGVPGAASRGSKSSVRRPGLKPTRVKDGLA